MKRFVIAGTNSGVGKTTLTIGLMAALQQRGLRVQGFKCGPDYIDPSFHKAVTGRPSRNIDSFMFEANVVRDIVRRATKDSDVGIIEGVMGFYDGKDPLSDVGSTADIAVITETPVVLVVNCAAMARSAAAIVKGFQVLSEKPTIVAVIANQVGSASHFNIVKKAIEAECGVPVIGYLKKNSELHMPSRHLGLIPALERGEMQKYFDELAALVNETIDLEALLALTEASDLTVEASVFDAQQAPCCTIAVAHDAAFNFYYEENIELLQANGARIVYFSPLANEAVPEAADGLYIGGGFPEEFATTLSENGQAKASIQAFIAADKPVFAECGGFMYLTEAIETLDGRRFDMVGAIPGTTKMQSKRVALGYREIFGKAGNFLLDEGMTAKGHEFHYSTYEQGQAHFAYDTKSRFKATGEGYMQPNLVAGYTHFHFASNPEVAARFVRACVKGE
ncbi:cobyrinate a,c-diamide synthase [Kurthia huakuii]|uniref:cobyrinate a,c-diamide synthase n=1 Tax=Kurthia huakuii TaxID=1421019 RepID=UPI0004966707|nr:cobyrinate a,c-diamide synthase [Kurthia huakuii]MBM7699465.1 cobyrinic acid a,c-diamide synthase [Kurthia huakuii]